MAVAKRVPEDVFFVSFIRAQLSAIGVWKVYISTKMALAVDVETDVMCVKERVSAHSMKRVL